MVRIFILLLAVVFTVNWSIVSAFGAHSFYGIVSRVKDGDSIVVKRGRRQYEIRLYGIDAPEYGQPGGKKAFLWLKRNIAGKSVFVRGINRDRYGRLVAFVSSGKECINEKLVRYGLARVYSRYCHKKICSRWLRQENEARQKGRGLWRQQDSVAPWIWRRQHSRK